MHLNVRLVFQKHSSNNLLAFLFTVCALPNPDTKLRANPMPYEETYRDPFIYVSYVAAPPLPAYFLLYFFVASEQIHTLHAEEKRCAKNLYISFEKVSLLEDFHRRLDA